MRKTSEIADFFGPVKARALLTSHAYTTIPCVQTLPQSEAERVTIESAALLFSRAFFPECLFVCWLVGCLTSQQQASVSQGRICSDKFTCCHTEIEVADQTFYLTQSQYTDTGPTSPSADPRTPGAWQGSHWSANV